MKKTPITELTCASCKLPSFPGLPPLIAVAKYFELTEKTTRHDRRHPAGEYEHAVCPSNSVEILQDIEEHKNKRAAAREKSQHALVVRR